MVNDHGGNRVERVWYPANFNVWVAELRDHSARIRGDPNAYYDQVHAALDECADNAGGWIMSSWVLGKDSTGAISAAIRLPRGRP